MKKFQNFLVNLDLYNTQIMVHCGSKWGLLQALQPRLPAAGYRDICDLMEDVYASPTVQGRTMRDSHTGAIVLWMREPYSKKSEAAWHGVLAHEIFHAVELMFERIGVPLSADTSEVYAYTVGYISQRVYENLMYGSVFSS